MVSLRSFDLNGDGALELLTGWSSGKVDARLCSNGQVIFKVMMNAPIAGLVEADYRRIGRSDLVIVTVTGEGTSVSYMCNIYDLRERFRKQKRLLLFLFCSQRIRRGIGNRISGAR